MRIFDAGDEDVAGEILDVLRNGGVAVIPTDTVYGLCALPSDRNAVARIFDIKGRPQRSAVAVMVAGIAEARRLGEFSPAALKMAERWPGPLTLVLPRTPVSKSFELGGDGATIGLRVPNHPFALGILRATGALAATSANRSGLASPATVRAVAGALGDRVDLYVDGGEIAGRPSRVVSLVGPAEVLRE